MALDQTTFPKVTTVVDTTIEESTSLFAIRANATDATLFITGKDLVAYLKKLETKDAALQYIDFEALRNEVQAQAQAAPAAPAAPAAAGAQEDARIEGAVQIAIGIKKEVDFATWYTNVSGCHQLIHEVDTDRLSIIRSF